MKRFLGILLVLTILLSCFTMVQFSVAAEDTETYVGKAFMVKEDVSSAVIRTTKGKWDLGTPADGKYSISYTVYNEGGASVKVKLLMQDDWDYYTNSMDGTSVIIPANAARTITYSYNIVNGLVEGKGKTDNVSLCFELLPAEGGLGVVLGGTKVTIKYNTTDGTDVARHLGSIYTTTEKIGEVTSLPKIGIKLTTNVEAPNSYMYCRANAGLTEFIDGEHSVQYYVYNPNSYPISVQFYMQNKYATVNGNGGQTEVIQPGKKAILTYTYQVTDGVYHDSGIKATDMTIRFDIRHESGSIPAGTSIYVEYAGDMNTDPARNLNVTLYLVDGDPTIIQHALLPNYSVDYVSVSNGNVESGLTNWGWWDSGSIALSSDTKTGEGKCIEFTPKSGKKYGTPAFDVTAAIIKDDTLKYGGHGAGSYKVTFDAKASANFSTGVVIGSDLHRNADDVPGMVGKGVASDYTSTWKKYSTHQTFTTDWQTYTLIFEIEEKRYNTWQALYEAGNENAYKLLLRFDASTSGYKDAQTTKIYVDNVTIEPYILSDEPTGLYIQGSKAIGEGVTDPYLILGYNNAAGGTFSEKDIVDGKLMFKQYIFNESDTEVAFTPKMQVYTGSAWSGPASKNVVLERKSGAWITVSADLDENNMLVVGGNPYDVSKVFLRFNFTGVIDSSIKLVLTAPEGYYQSLSSKSGNFNVIINYEKKYSEYPPDTIDAALDTEFHINSAFGSHMVLQREREFKVWGYSAYVGKSVNVQFKDQLVSTTVPEDGKWSVTFKAEKASKIGANLTATCNGKTHTIEDVLVGDVFLIGGQSNAEKTLAACGTAYSQAYKDSLIASANGNIRLFKQGAADAKSNPETMLTPQYEVIAGNKWAIETPFTASTFSAMGIFFAHRIYNAVDVPIGMINVSSGGSPLSQLMSKEASEAANYTRYENNIPVSGMYNALLSPFINMSVTGMIFYQGESENGLAVTDYGKYNEYFKIYIDDIRAKNGNNFPVYYVQLSSHTTTDWNGTAEQRAVQFDALKMIDNVGMVVSMDQGFRATDSDFAHPNYKEPVGNRLGDLALADYYGLLDESQVTSPMPTTAVMDEEGNVIITFKNVAGGLKRIGQHETLTGFKAIVGGKYVDVAAQIVGNNKVKLDTASLSGVTGVGYGLELLAFADYPEGNGDLKYVANLGNSKDLPAPTFKMNLETTITGANTAVDSTLTVNFFGTAKGEMKFEYNGKTYTVEGEFDEAIGAYKYAFLGVNPQCMGDTITATLYVDGVEAAEKINYSVKEYCNNIFNNGKPEGYTDDEYNKLISFMADMLDYGNAAQEYMGYKTGAPVNDLDWIEKYKTEFTAPESVRDVTETENPDYKFKSCGLHFSNLISVYVRLQVADKNNVTIDVQRGTQQVATYDASDLVGDVLYLDGLRADELDDVFVLTLKVNGTAVQTLTYSANSYIAAKYTSDTVGTLVQAVGRYGASAELVK